MLNIMLKTFYKAIKIFIPIIFLAATVYFFRTPLFNLWIQLRTTYLPCAQPIGYTLSSFDAKFGISKSQFLSALDKAEQIWEKPIGKQLFVNEPNGNLKINLIFDYRQEATIKLRKLGLTVNDDRASYDALKLKYKALETDYAKKSTLFKSQLNTFENHKNEYEAKVTYWNDRGGATPKAYEQLNQEKAALDAELVALNKLQDGLNAAVDNINAMIAVLNRLASALNIDAGLYNQTSQSRGQEFEEGLYTSGPDGQKIDIYQFDSTDKLVRVLAHELGHALGLDHLDNPKAIMYRLNQGANAKLTADDLAALKTLCKVK